MAINTQKLLPSAKGSPLAKLGATKIISSTSIKRKTTNISKSGALAKRDEPGQIARTLTDIDIRLKNLLREEQKQQSKKRKEKEKADFEKEEKKLEAPKEAKRFNLPKLSLPGASFLDRIKRFLFFTALGWLFTKFQDQLPKLEGILKTITQVYGVAENIFKFLLESFVNVIDRGYKAYDKVRDLAKSIGGEKAQKDFDNLSSKLNEYINYALIGGIALTGAINSFSKEVQTRRNASTGATGGAAAGVGSYKPQALPDGVKPGTIEGRGITSQQKIAERSAKKAARRTAGAQLRRGQQVTQQVVGKQTTRQALKFLKGPLSRLPIVGGLIEFGLSWALGDPIGKAAFRGVGTLLLGAVGSLILPGWGTFIGGFLGAELAGKLYEVLFENKQPKGKVQAKQGGGPVTRGGKTQSGPSRSITITRRKPPKIKPKQSQPGKDVGGKKKIRELYPDPSVRTDIEGDQKGAWWNLLPPLANDATPEQIQQRNDKIKALPNSYKALTGVAKKLKDIPFGIGALMGGAVDVALGEKLPQNAIQSLSNGISYLISSIANQQISSSLSGIEKEISRMQSGGAVPKLKDFTKRDDLELGKDINKVLGGLIQQKVDEAIREVQKQLMPGKYAEKVTPSGERGPSAPPTRGPGGGGGGGLPLTGDNGRMKRSQLIRVGTLSSSPEGGPYWYGSGAYLRKSDAGPAFLRAKESAKKEGVSFVINSAYRSLEHQRALQGKYSVVARVGGSPHGEGIALDIQTETKGWNWLKTNGLTYGWKWMAIENDKVHFEYVGGGRLNPQKPPGQPPQQRPPGQPPQQRPPGQPPQQRPQPTGKDYKGSASWYGRKDGFHGKPTSSGEVFNTDKLTAAIQIGLRGEFGGVRGKSQLYYAKVTNLDNGKTVTVKINDVGPLSSGGVIDLSEAAFKQVSSGGLGQGRLYNVSVQKMGPAPRENSRVASVESKSKDQIAQVKSNTDFSSLTPYFSDEGGNLGVRPNVLMGLEKVARNATNSYQSENILENKDIEKMQGGGYIPKQNPKNRTSSLTKYPSYSAEGGMMIAIQPMIIEKTIPVPAGRRGGGGAVVFPIAGVNNSNMQSLSRG